MALFSIISQYLICKQICFIVVCLVAFVASLAILYSQSKLEQLFDLIYPSFDQDLTLLVKQKEHFIEMLDTTAWINLSFSPVVLIDITPGNFFIKFTFALVIWLSMISQFLVLIKVPYLTYNRIDLMTHYLICAELLIFFIYMLSIFTCIKIYFQVIDRLMSSNECDLLPGKSAIELPTLLTMSNIDADHNTGEDKRIDQGNEQTITVD